MSRWLRRQRRVWTARVENPAPDATMVVLAVLLLTLLANLPSCSRLDAPLLDLIVRSLPRNGDPADILIVDLETWSPDSVPQRALGRQQLARLVNLLGGREGLSVGLDVLLQDLTSDEADGALAAALAAHPEVVVATEVLPGAGGWMEVPLAEPFRTGNPRGLISVVLDRAGWVLAYGLDDRLHHSLAGQLVARMAPDRALPRGPVVVHAPPGLPLEQRWTTMTVSELLAHPEMVDRFPTPAIVLIGLAGDVGRQLDGHLVRGDSGEGPIPGMCVHALVAEDLLTDRQIAVGRWPQHLAAVGLYLALFQAALWTIAAVRRRRGGRSSTPRPGVVTALVLAVLAIPYSVLMVAALGATFSVITVMVGPFVLKGFYRHGAELHRRMRRGSNLGRVENHVPEAVERSLRAAYLVEDPTTRLTALLDAYEDVIHYLAVLLLATRPVPGPRAGAVKDPWHRAHTLQTVLATLHALDRELGERIWRLSCCADDPVEDAILRSHLETRDPQVNWFVILRNSLAHDTTSWWLDDAAASMCCIVLQNRLVAILHLSAVRDLLEQYSLAGTPDPGAVGASERVPAMFEPAEAGVPAVSAGPWLVWRRVGEDGPQQLLRYRGEAKRKHWLKVDGKRSRTVTFTPYGLTRSGLHEEVHVLAEEIGPEMPEDLRMQ